MSSNNDFGFYVDEETTETPKKQTSINRAKKEIWQRLQSLVGDPEFWESTIIDCDWDQTAFDKALNSVYWQLEKKL